MKKLSILSLMILAACGGASYEKYSCDNGWTVQAKLTDTEAVAAVHTKNKIMDLVPFPKESNGVYVRGKSSITKNGDKLLMNLPNDKFMCEKLH